MNKDLYNENQYGFFEVGRLFQLKAPELIGQIFFPELNLNRKDIKELNLKEITQSITGLNLEIIRKIEQCLNLTFLPYNETQSEVCFANYTELRPEFKLCFTLSDIIDYIYAVLTSGASPTNHNESATLNSLKVPYPEDAEIFWTLVKSGGEIRQKELGHL